MTSHFKNIRRPSEEAWSKMEPSDKRAELIRRRPEYEIRLAAFMELDHIPFDIQVPIGCYFADFQLIPHKLIVEVDGMYHGNMTQKLMDIRRGEFLKNKGYSIIRVTNEQLDRDITGVCWAIRKVLEKKTKKRRDL